VTKVRLGQLNGLFGAGKEYGLYAGNGTTDASTFIRLGSLVNRVNNLPLEWWTGGARFAWVDSTAGYAIRSTTVQSGVRAFKFYDSNAGTSVVGGLYGWNTAGAGGDTDVIVQARGDSLSQKSTLELLSFAGDAKASQVYQAAVNNLGTAYLDMNVSAAGATSAMLSAQATEIRGTATLALVASPTRIDMTPTTVLLLTTGGTLIGGLGGSGGTGANGEYGALIRPHQAQAIANNASINTGAWTGLMFIQQSGNTYAIYAISGAAAPALVVGGTAFSTTAGNAGTINVYKSGSDIIVQNMTGGSRTVYIHVLSRG
jgi:hypothetical protein